MAKSRFSAEPSATVQYWLPVRWFLHPSPKSDTAVRHLQKVTVWLFIRTSCNHTSKILNYPFNRLLHTFVKSHRLNNLFIHYLQSQIFFFCGPLNSFFRNDSSSKHIFSRKCHVRVFLSTTWFMCRQISESNSLSLYCTGNTWITSPLHLFAESFQLAANEGIRRRKKPGEWTQQ